MLHAVVYMQLFFLFGRYQYQFDELDCILFSLDYSLCHSSRAKYHKLHNNQETMKQQLKAGLHMIADDGGSQIADRRSQKVLRSSAIIWKHTSAIVCDPAIVIADDRRRSQKIEPCSIFCDRLRSSAIVCDPAIIWKPKFCDLRSKCVP